MGPPIVKQESDFKYIRERLDSRVPDTVVSAIVASKDPKKIDAINAVAAKIKKHAQQHKEYAINFAGWEFAFKVLRNEKIAKALVDKPEQIANALMQLLEYVREGTRGRGDINGGAFEALETTELGAVFVTNPAVILKSFRRISDYAAGHYEPPAALQPTAETLKKLKDQAGERRAEAFGYLAHPVVASVFAKHMDAVVQMCSYAGEATPVILKSLGGFLPLLEHDPRSLLDSFKAIRQYSSGRYGDMTGNITAAFEALVKITGLFVAHPKEFVEISKSAGILTCYAYGAFIASHIGKPINEYVRKLLSENPQGVVERFRKIKEYAGEAAFVLFAPIPTPAGDSSPPEELIELFVKHIDYYWQAKESASLLGIPNYSTEVYINFAYAIATIGLENTKALHRRFGIDYFGRYTPKQLEDLCGKVTHVPGKPVLLIVFNKNDWNKAFYSDGKKLEVFMAHYNVIITEVKSETEFFAKVKGMSDDYGKIDTLLIGGHGTPDSIILGNPVLGEGDPTVSRDVDTLDLTDADQLVQAKDSLIGKPTIVLVACSTGQDEKSIGALMSRVWNARLFAPVAPTDVENYEFDRNGRLQNVKYTTITNVFERGMIPKRTQQSL